jgi:hypothetical protein
MWELGHDPPTRPAAATATTGTAQRSALRPINSPLDDQMA